MNNTTFSGVSSNDEILFSYKNSYLVIQIYFWGYLILFLFGFTGNIASLLTFSRPTLRNNSTGFLLIALAISDTIYLLGCIIDFVEFGLQIQIYTKVAYDTLCRFRFFIFHVTQLNSAWILVCISFDRWFRTRFPYKVVSVCTPKNAMLATVVNLIFAMGLNLHMLAPFFGTFIPGIASLACGPSLYTHIEYITWYFKEWSTLLVFTSCLIPAFLMILTLFDIIVNIGTRRRAAFNQNQRVDPRTRHLQKQIFILLMSRIAIFLATTLPLYNYRILAPRNVTVTSLTQSQIDILAILTWNLNLNYTANFYLHCLTSKLFRKEFIAQMKILCCQTRRVHPAVFLQTRHHLQNSRY